METLNWQQLAHLEGLEASLRWISENIKERIVFSTSFGLEDQVITHAICANQLNNIELVTLDTGRLFAQTYTTWQMTLDRYQRTIQAYYPDAENLHQFVSKEGINAFYESVALRKQCCHLRKIEPLRRALKDATVWITGLRAEQAENRQKQELVEWDEALQLFKINPLLHWKQEQVKDYVSKHHIPFNVLHEQGFVSIGCAPCTRAIQPGQAFRAGRWWWEDGNQKECGLHHKLVTE